MSTTPTLPAPFFVSPGAVFEDLILRDFPLFKLLLPL